MKMRIGELAKAVGCPVVTLRFYEKEGLLTKPERTGNNYRLYGDKEIERLVFIKHCRRHGMTLSEIRELLAFKDNPNINCDWVGALVTKHIASVEEQIQSLAKLKEQLETLSHKCASGNNGQCGIIESLSSAEGCPFCEDYRCKQQHEPRRGISRMDEIFPR